MAENGSSLLPAGVTAVEGRFERGDAVLVLDAERRELARGIVRYDSADLARIAGCRSDQIAERLGYEYGPVAVHRNDMILI
jgi:glutamate 5-kinase